MKKKFFFEPERYVDWPLTLRFRRALAAKRILISPDVGEHLAGLTKKEFVEALSGCVAMPKGDMERLSRSIYGRSGHLTFMGIADDGRDFQLTVDRIQWGAGTEGFILDTLWTRPEK